MNSLAWSGILSPCPSSNELPSSSSRKFCPCRARLSVVEAEDMRFCSNTALDRSADSSKEKLLV